MERSKTILNPLALLVVAILFLCLVAPGTALAAADGSTLQAGSVAQSSKEAALGTQAAKKVNVTLYANSSTQGTKKLKATGLIVSKAKWTTSKESVVTVKAGKVTAKKAGKATVKAVVGKKTFIFNVTVKNVAINKKKLTLKEGELAAKALKLTGDKVKSVKSSNKKVVKFIKLSNAVTLKGGSAGTATVTVVTKANKKFTCKVTVKAGASIDVEKAITGIKKNSVILDYNIKKFPEGHFIHLKVKDDSISFDKWSKSLELQLAEGVTFKLERNEAGDTEYEGYKVISAKLTVMTSKMSLTYTVEAFQASSGMFELT